jgi:hypothetical protein
LIFSITSIFSFVNTIFVFCFFFCWPAAPASSAGGAAGARRAKTIELRVRPEQRDGGAAAVG